MTDREIIRACCDCQRRHAKALAAKDAEIAKIRARPPNRLLYRILLTGQRILRAVKKRTAGV